MIIMVMDGQGGGVRAAIIKDLLTAISQQMEIGALGTNSIATSRMMKAGANRGAPQGKMPLYIPAPGCTSLLGDSQSSSPMP